MIVRAQLIDVLFVIAPHSLLLDIAGPAEAFRLANQHRGRQGLPPRFRLRFAAPSVTQATSVGLSIAGLEPLPDELATPTWVVVAGQPTEHLDRVLPAASAVARWLGWHLGAALRDSTSENRLVTVCSGTLLAARAGLLGGRHCTTHHELLPALRALAPDARVLENKVFVMDGRLASSAGITVGIDVALQLIGEECGEALAARVAEDMVVYMRRSDRDPEQSPLQLHRGHLHPAVHRVQDAMVNDPARDWSMAALARVGHATERHLHRLFLEHAGMSPLQYLRAIRLERARQALEHGANVTRAAAVAGFRSDLQMRRAWSRQWGGSPRDVLRALRPQPVRARCVAPDARDISRPGPGSATTRRQSP
ncbi:MAG TPA: helix-turn-helix domain-containing protein [Gemmatimonadales bacterium]|nr:helix-turn-helix domain-containing protein [Gemmatimonadales bacterium]